MSHIIGRCMCRPGGIPPSFRSRYLPSTCTRGSLSPSRLPWPRRGGVAAAATDPSTTGRLRSYALLLEHAGPLTLALHHAAPVGVRVVPGRAALLEHRRLAAEHSLPVVAAQVAEQGVVGGAVLDRAVDEDHLGSHSGIHDVPREGPQATEHPRRQVHHTVTHRLRVMTHQQVERLAGQRQRRRVEEREVVELDQDEELVGRPHAGCCLLVGLGSGVLGEGGLP
mmetsp:Transcript_4877/g.15398  ORF Transcript_4877/g.15398 Transcript_4877/m.15398 type:complete len:224 (-) Transcript_4877:708-1379(-)